MTAERADREPLPISLVAHHVFCPRRAWLEAMGETTDIHQMAVRLHEHRASEVCAVLPRPVHPPRAKAAGRRPHAIITRPEQPPPPTRPSQHSHRACETPSHRA